MWIYKFIDFSDCNFGWLYCRTVVIRLIGGEFSISIHQCVYFKIHYTEHCEITGELDYSFYQQHYSINVYLKNKKKINYYRQTEK